MIWQTFDVMCATGREGTLAFAPRVPASVTNTVLALAVGSALLFLVCRSTQGLETRVG